jgi:ribosomal protein S13
MEQLNIENKNIKNIREYFELLRPLARVFARYGVYELRIDEEAETFYFDHQRREIIVSLRLIEELNLEKEEKKYILLHELGHLVQLFQDPESYLESFEITEREAERRKENKEAYQRAWDNFFNVFLDIHVNSMIRALMPIYQRGERLERLPANLYSRKLLPKRDYSNRPLSSQFLNYLLRRVMAPDEEVIVSERVKSEIEQRIPFFGREYPSLEVFVREEIFNPHKTIEDIMFILKEILMPIYEKLLEEDAKEGRLQEIPVYIGEIPMDRNISKKVIEKIVKGIKESQQSGDKKYRENQKKRFEEWAKDKGFSEEEIRRFEEIIERTLEIISDLEDIWRNFIQRSVEITRGKVAGFKTGTSIFPQELIRELPVLLTQPSEAKIFYRYLPETKSESIQPRKINLVLIVDLSGSMNEEKRKAVQEVAYAINKSLINFYRTGALSVIDQGIEFPVDINYRILGFGDSVKELTETTDEERKERSKKDRPNRDLDEELLRAILKIERIDLISTQDALALQDVKNSITPEIRAGLENGDEILVILEITDGETATPQESKALVHELNSIPNVYCRAIQIPGPIYSEKPKGETPEERLKPPEILPPTGTFREVWGEDWGKRLENLEVLKETVIAILYDALRQYAQ